MITTPQDKPQITLFICNCCQRPARAQTQPALTPGGAPLTQVECVTDGCHNQYWTLTFRAGDDNRQLTDRYTPVTMDAGQVARFVVACELETRAKFA